MCRILHICRKIFIYHTFALRLFLRVMFLLSPSSNAYTLSAIVKCWCNNGLSINLLVFDRASVCFSRTLAAPDWNPFRMNAEHFRTFCSLRESIYHTNTLGHSKIGIIEWNHLIELLHKFIKWSCFTAFSECFKPSTWLITVKYTLLLLCCKYKQSYWKSAVYK